MVQDEHPHSASREPTYSFKIVTQKEPIRNNPDKQVRRKNKPNETSLFSHKGCGYKPAIMAKKLSREILNQGVKGAGPDTGTLSFSVKVRRSIPDFLNSVNLRYVKLGYNYLIDHGLYLAVTPILVLIIGAEIGKFTWEEFSSRYDVIHAISVMGLVVVMVYVYLDLTPQPTYLLDFACYRPPAELKVSKEKFIELAKNSGNFDDSAIEFQQRVLTNSGIGDETYLPKSVFLPGHKITLKDGREEAAMVIFGAIDDLLAKTGVRTKDINILVVNCGTLNTTPSLSALVVNHYKFQHNIHTFNLGGMGCAAGAIAVDLAKDTLNAHLGSYALVVSTEAVSHTWYMGKDKDMLLPNCFFRMGAAAMLLSSRRRDRWYSKYELKHLVRTHTGMEKCSFNCIHTKEDAKGRKGISVNKDLMEVGRQALKDNITTLGQLVFPSTNTKPNIPNYQLAFEHVCILAASRMILDELQKNLELTNVEASRMTLQRFGNTSSSSVWYELAYLEANKKIKKGDQIWQIGFGSGFKCNSVFWKALKKAHTGPHKTNPWIEQ